MVLCRRFDHALTVSKMLIKQTHTKGETYMDNFAIRLKELRRSYNYTQKELAYEIGASEHSIYAWENGQRLPNVSFLRKLCMVFRVSVDYIMGWDE